MSVLSVPKPASLSKKTEPLSAAAFLGAATKKTTKNTNHLIYSGAGAEDAVRWLALHFQAKETERELGLLHDVILRLIGPWHEDICVRRRAHVPTVEIPTKSGTLRVSFQHRYVKLPLDREAELRDAVNGDFERYFKRAVSFKLRKEVADDPARLEQVVLALVKALGADHFAELFEVEQTWAPTKAFTETTCQLPEETRAALATAGVKQVVALAAM